MDHFDHETMVVSKAAIELIALAAGVAENLPRSRAALADQLHRACTSVALNIAEAAGEFAGDEKARFYRLAKRSGTACAAVLDVCRCLWLANAPALDSGPRLLLRIVSMRIALIRRAAGGPGTGTGTE